MKEEGATKGAFQVRFKGKSPAKERKKYVETGDKNEKKKVV